MNILLYTELNLVRNGVIVDVVQDPEIPNQPLTEFLYVANFELSAIPEMTLGCFSLDIEEDQWLILDAYLEVEDNKLEIIGEWKFKDGKVKDGLDEDGNPVEVIKEKNKYKKAKYSKYLLDVPDTYNEDGTVDKWKKAPEDTPVNKFAGWVTRDLTIEVA